MAEPSTFNLPAADGVSLFVYRSLPAGPPRGVVQMVHGMAEHAGRYAALAEVLNGAGFAVYAHDHRGHGRTVTAPGDLGYFGEGIGWTTVVGDLGVVRHRIAADFPGLPVVLLGHSMGAFLAQQFAARPEADLSGLVLTGTYRESRLLARGGTWLVGLERWRLGPRGRSRLLRAVTFDAFNRRFAPNRTRYDWLSRDTQAVDRYMADAHCGFAPSVQLWCEVLGALAAGLPSPPPGLPVCLLAGEHDPVGRVDSGAAKLAAQFRATGSEVTHRVYPGARHELFHELNREEVIGDLLAWLDTVFR